jgi:hypothetical protein
VAEPAPVSAQSPEPEIAEQLPLIRRRHIRKTCIRSRVSKLKCSLSGIGERLPLIGQPRSRRA